MRRLRNRLAVLSETPGISMASLRATCPLLLLVALNQDLQSRFRVSITPTMIIAAFNREEIPADMVELIEQLDGFRREPTCREDGDADGHE